MKSTADNYALSLNYNDQIRSKWWQWFTGAHTVKHFLAFHHTGFNITETDHCLVSRKYIMDLASDIALRHNQHSQMQHLNEMPQLGEKLAYIQNLTIFFCLL